MNAENVDVARERREMKEAMEDVRTLFQKLPYPTLPAIEGLQGAELKLVTDMLGKMMPEMAMLSNPGCANLSNPENIGDEGIIKVSSSGEAKRGMKAFVYGMFIYYLMPPVEASVDDKDIEKPANAKIAREYNIAASDSQVALLRGFLPKEFADQLVVGIARANKAFRLNVVTALDHMIDGLSVDDAVARTTQLMYTANDISIDGLVMVTTVADPVKEAMARRHVPQAFGGQKPN